MNVALLSYQGVLDHQYRTHDEDLGLRSLLLSASSVLLVLLGYLVSHGRVKVQMGCIVVVCGDGHVKRLGD